ncbi:unnamed protein product [Trichobilharzia szidati]|nr:unnamed protein product [Trichobilharzia szidati]
MLFSLNRGRFLGEINHKYRTKATNDSFVKARENLVKEVENTRQQKLEVLDYQLKVASSLKDKRNTKTERNLQRNSVSKPALKKLKVSETRNVTRTPATRSKIPRKLDVTAKTANRGSQKLSGITSPSTPKSPVKRAKTRVEPTEEKATTEKDPLKEIEAVIHRKCISAIRKRQKLEQRLCKAYKKIDEKKRAKEIEKIKADLCAFVDELYNDELLRKWIPVPQQVSVTNILQAIRFAYCSEVMSRWKREVLRGVIYLGIPYLMFTLSGMPALTEYVHNYVRKDRLDRSGLLVFWNHQETARVGIQTPTADVHHGCAIPI